MLKNVYTPLSGAIAQERAIEVIANNLANLNTVGFKGDNVTFTLQEPDPYPNYKSPIPPANYKIAFKDLQYLHGNDLNYAGIAGMSRDVTQGPSIVTQNPSDVMIEGDGYFQVNTQDGIRFTRAGNLSIATDGALITPEGDPILGEKGVIYVREGGFKINEAAEVYQDGELVDRLKLFRFKDKDAIERAGRNYLLYSGHEDGVERITSPRVRQGFVEGSNVNAMKNLTAMIMAHRSYEAYQKTVSNLDSMMEKSSNSIGVVRA